MMGKTACGELACPRTLSGVESACIYLLLAVAALAANPSQATVQPDGGKSAAAQVITIFFTGNELGALKPCGCSGGQLGGLDRRNAVLNTVGSEGRLVLDTGSLVAESTEQNLIKFNIVVQAFSQLGYDLVNLTEQDILIARQAGLLDVLGSAAFSVIAAGGPEDADLPAKFTKRFTLDGNSVDLTVAAIDTEEQVPRLTDLFAASADKSSSTVKVLISNRLDAKTVTAGLEPNLIDLLIVPPQSDEPTLVSDANTRPFVVSAGRLGKYVGKVVITAGPTLTFSVIPVTEDLPQNQAIVDIYKDYQRLLKEANLLEKYPRFILPDNLQYVGSKSCKLCHDYEYEKCLTSSQVFIPRLPKQASLDSRHADAFATLEKIGSDYDPECVICHVVGMQFQSGFISPEKTPDLKDVGCENCHGPGSDHLRSLGAVETSGPMSSCTDCHTSEHSAEYAGNEKQYFEKIIHWKQPLSAVRVKEPDRKP